MKKSKVKKPKKKTLDNIKVDIINRSGARQINFSIDIENVEEKEIVAVMVRDIKKAVSFCKYRLKARRGKLNKPKIKEFKGLDPIPKFQYPGTYGHEFARLLQDKIHTPVKMDGKS